MERKEVNSGTDTVRSTSSSQHQRERHSNTVEQSQEEQTVSRVGNLPKKVATRLPKFN